MLKPAIQIHPMVPLAKASAILKISRDELIRRLTAGELLGEKRRIGDSKKDSWFIYADEFDRLLAQALAKYEERISTRGMDHLFNPAKAGYIADYRLANKVQSQSSQSNQTNTAAAAEMMVPPPAVLPKMVMPPVQDHVLDFSASDTDQHLSETVEIQPVNMDQHGVDPSEIVDALGTNYALGGDYDDDSLDSFDASPAESSQSQDNENYDLPIGLDNPHVALNHLATANGSTGLQVGQAMVAQLVQHLQEERQAAQALVVRLSVLEEEVEQLRREMLARPDQSAHSPFAHIKNYFRLLLGKST